jgi:hypothetical protein
MTDTQLLNAAEEFHVQVWFDRKSGKWTAFREVPGCYPIQPTRDTLRECLYAATTNLAKAKPSK